MYFHISNVSFGASNALFFSHNVTLLLQNSASSASKIIRRKYKNNFEHLLNLKKTTKHKIFLMKRFLKWAGIIVIALIFISTFVFLWQQSRPKETNYETYDVKYKDITKSTIVTGKIEPRDEVSIKPQISGIIAELYKHPGEMVKAGEVIAKVKVIPDMSNLSSAENRVKLADISLKQCLTDYKRMKQLHQEQVVSDEDYEASEVKYRQALEELKNAKDALTITRDGVSLSNTQMSTTLIRSTIDGLILDIPVKVGNSVILSNSFNDGTTIATVANMNDLIFHGNIDETEVGRIREGMPVSISIGAMPDVTLDATLEYISPKGVQTGGANQFEIKAAIRIPKNINIRSGYSANGKIVLATAKHTLTIPEAGLNYEGEQAFVYVVKDSTDGKINYERRNIQTGISDGLNIEVKKGLKQNDKIRGIEKTDEEG